MAVETGGGVPTSTGPVGKGTAVSRVVGRGVARTAAVGVGEAVAVTVAVPGTGVSARTEVLPNAIATASAASIAPRICADRRYVARAGISLRLGLAVAYRKT